MDKRTSVLCRGKGDIVDMESKRVPTYVGNKSSHVVDH